MPLPPAPTKRAALLPPEAYDAPARSSHKASRKSEAIQAESPLAEKPQAWTSIPAAVVTFIRQRSGKTRARPICPSVPPSKRR